MQMNVQGRQGGSRNVLGHLVPNRNAVDWRAQLPTGVGYSEQRGARRAGSWHRDATAARRHPGGVRGSASPWATSTRGRNALQTLPTLARARRRAGRQQWWRATAPLRDLDIGFRLKRTVRDPVQLPYSTPNQSSDRGSTHLPRIPITSHHQNRPLAPPSASQNHRNPPPLPLT